MSEAGGFSFEADWSAPRIDSSAAWWNVAIGAPANYGDAAEAWTQELQKHNGQITAGMERLKAEGWRRGYFTEAKKGDLIARFGPAIILGAVGFAAAGSLGAGALTGEGEAWSAMAESLTADATATASTSAAATATGAQMDLVDSIGNFGDWIVNSDGAGTMYNPTTGEYLTADGVYNPGSLGSPAGGPESFTDSYWQTYSSGGQATNRAALSDILGKLNTGAAKALSSLFQTTANNRAQPNLSQSIASSNLLPLAVIGFLAWKVMA